jgi:lambda repressor-like predicted transcriptional regulator
MAGKHVTVSDLILHHKDEITKLKDAGVTTSALVIKFGTSRNTMTRALIKMGFPGPKWTEKKYSK